MAALMALRSHDQFEILKAVLAMAEEQDEGHSL